LNKSLLTFRKLFVKIELQNIDHLPCTCKIFDINANQIMIKTMANPIGIKNKFSVADMEIGLTNKVPSSVKKLTRYKL